MHPVCQFLVASSKKSASSGPNCHLPSAVAGMVGPLHLNAPPHFRSEVPRPSSRLVASRLRKSLPIPRWSVAFARGTARRRWRGTAATLGAEAAAAWSSRLRTPSSRQRACCSRKLRVRRGSSRGCQPEAGGPFRACGRPAPPRSTSTGSSRSTDAPATGIGRLSEMCSSTAGGIAVPAAPPPSP